MKQASITHKLIFFYLLLLMGLTATAFAQNTEKIIVPIEWGKVLPMHVKKTEHAAFPNANAVIIGDYGSMDVEGGRLIINRHIRIQILKEQGLSQASIDIPYYSYRGAYTCANVRAQSFTMQGNEMIKTKVKKTDIFTEPIDERWKVKKFAIPNVKVGSIIEYSYRLTSGGISILDDWEFHNDIPTLYSGFTIKAVPDYLDFVYFMEGEELYQKYKSASTDRSHWSLTNIPPLEKEPFCANANNYANKVRLHLRGYSINGKYEKVWSDWPQIVEEQLWENDRFNYPFKSKKKYADQVQLLTLISKGDHEKMKAVYGHCRQFFTWSGRHSLLFDKSEMKSFEKGMEMNSAGINLYLTAMLREAGMEAYPMLISTRKHGKIHKTVPLITQFNHVIACVIIEGSAYFLDASAVNQPIGFLPVKDMNNFGLLARKKNPVWLNLPTPRQNTVVSQYSIDLSDINAPSYQVVMQYKGVPQVSERDKLMSEGEKNYINSKFPELQNGFRLDSFQIEHKKDINKPLAFTCSLSSDGTHFEKLGELIYIPPMLDEMIINHPFQNEKRYYPVEFPHVRQYIFTVKITLPPGYEIEEQPENLQLALPNKVGKFNYSIMTQGQNVTVSSTLHLTKGEIAVKDYAQLRTFFTEVIGKMEEMMILKQVSSK